MTDSTTATPSRFHAAAAEGADWTAAVAACAGRLGDVGGCTLGLLYVTEDLAPHAAGIVTMMRSLTGIHDWIGTVGLGVMAGEGRDGEEEEFFDRPAVAAMALRLPPDSFRLFPAVSGDMTPLRRAAGAWLDRRRPTLAIIHADPRTMNLPETIALLGDTTGAFVVGGMTSTRGDNFVQFAVPGSTATMDKGPVSGGAEGIGVSGVLLGDGAEVATGLTQGCTPIGPVRTITEANENILISIDGRPALEVFKEDIGELLARDLQRVAGYIFAGLGVPGSDTGDYLVRNLVAIDPRKGWIAVAEHVENGQPVRFTRRDKPSAETDLRRMLAGLKRRLPAPPKGALYVSCIARGPNQFGAGREIAIIREEMGDVPLAGFFASGEISHARLYGYTGVLTVFL